MNGEFRMHWSSFTSGIDVRVRGTVTFKPDLTDVESLSDGGYLAIRTWSMFIPRTIEIRSEGGRLTHRYYVAGLSRPYDDDARRWLASELSTTLVRRLGLGAESRTRQILAADGVPGVLDEIRRLDGDHVRGRYFRELFRARPLDSASLTRTLALAASLIGSDFELSQTLRVAAPGAALETSTVQAYVDAANDIHSDFERRRALVALLQVGGAAAGTGDLVLRSAARMGSDFEKGIVLRSALETPTLDHPDALLPALRTMRSDFEKRRVVNAVHGSPRSQRRRQEGVARRCRRYRFGLRVRDGADRVRQPGRSRRRDGRRVFRRGQNDRFGVRNQARPDRRREENAARARSVAREYSTPYAGFLPISSALRCSSP